jgi:predicted nucleic acid-binding protein
MRNFILDTNILMAYLKADTMLLNKVSTLNAYAEIDAFSLQRHPTMKLKGSAKPMGKNDMWIAATAFATNATLLTADGKFMHLDKEFITIKFYQP